MSDKIPTHSSFSWNTVQAIVFDLDGTLIDSHAVTFEAFNRGFEAFGKPRLSPEGVMKLFGPSEKQIFSNAVGAQNADRAYEISKKCFLENLSQIKIFDGILTLLQFLKGKNIKLGIYTGRGLETTLQAVREKNLSSYFDTVVSAEEVARPKPFPDGIIEACRRLQVESNKAVYVGDTLSDLKAAKAAGSLAISAQWDQHAKKNNESKSLSDLAFETPVEFLEFLKK